MRAHILQKFNATAARETQRTPRAQRSHGARAATPAPAWRAQLLRWAAPLCLLAFVACESNSSQPWRAPLPPPLDAPVVDAEKLLRAELENGARVLLLEDARLPVVELGVVVPRGAGVETRAQAGLAHFTAELMARGAGTRDALALAQAVDALGATLTVTAGWDSVTVRLSGLARDADALLDLLADVALRPRFSRGEGVRARAEQSAALARAGDDPNTLVGWTFFETLWPAHRYGLPQSGTQKSVARFNAAQARAFHKKIFTPRGALLYAVGNFEAPALRARLQTKFASWKGASPLAPAKPPPAPSAARFVLVDRPDLGQAMVAVGHEGFARGADPRLEARMMNTILGRGGFSSRLMARLRAEEGLSYSVRSNFVRRRAGGAFVMRSFTEAPRTGALLDGLLEELARMSAAPPDAGEVRRAQTLASGSFSLALESSRAVATALLDLELYDLPRDDLDTYRRRVRALTPPAIAAAATRTLHPARASIVVVGPAETLAPILKKYGDFTTLTR